MWALRGFVIGMTGIRPDSRLRVTGRREARDSHADGDEPGNDDGKRPSSPREWPDCRHGFVGGAPRGVLEERL